MSANPNKIITLQELINAQVDAYKLELIMNEAPWVEITTRLGRKCYSIATIQGIIDQFQLDTQAELQNLQDAIAQIITGVLSDTSVQTWSGRTQEEKNKENISAQDFKAKGDGVTNDNQAFIDLEAEFTGRNIDLFGLDYLVDSIPDGNRYINGYFTILGEKHNADEIYRNNSVVVGVDAGKLRNKTGNYGAVIIGDRAAEECPSPKNFIAIGRNAGRYAGSNVNHNIAIGLETLLYVNGNGDGTTGTRNVAIGGNAQRFTTTGNNNVAIGRNSSQSNTTGLNNTAVGSNTLAGQGSLTFDGNTSIIRNIYPITWNQATAVGASAMYFGGAQNCVAVGAYALRNAKSIDTGNVALGVDAMLNVGSKTTYDGKVLVSDNRAGTYSMSTNTIMFALNSHGFSVGTSILVSIPNLGTTYSDPQRYSIVSVTDNTFTVTDTFAVSGQNGNFNMINYGTSTNAVASINNVAIGLSTMDSAQGSYNVAIGAQTLRQYTGDNFIALGRFTANAVKVGGFSQAIGNAAFQNTNNVLSSVGIGASVGGGTSSVDETVLIGRQAGDIGGTSGTLYRCTGIGAYSLRFNIDGSSFTSRSNSTAIGANSRVSADNQVQLGDSLTTTYAYGAVQDRSDIRDKSDIETMPEVMNDFVLGLKPVQGRWDMRDDYVDELFPPIAIPEEPVYPDQPIEPIEENFIFENDGVYINRTDLFNAALDKYKSDYQAYESEKSRLKAEYDAAMAAYNQANDIRTTEVKAWWANPSRDGSKKRTRKHNWFIAQEVKSLSDQLGIDFAGLQDHKLIDGTDTLTIGYEEFIPPIVATIQKLSKRMDEIELRLTALEK